MSSRNDPPREPPKRLGRPPNPAKLDAILETGWAMFLARGYEATSIEAVAAASGVSRVTVYKHFPDKGALFREAVLRAARGIEKDQSLRAGTASSSAPLAMRLERFGIGLMNFLVSPTAVAFYGVLSGELRQHPDVARAFYDIGPANTLRNLAALLEEAASQGEIELDVPPERAGEMLIGMWQGFSNYRLALGVGGTGEEDASLETQVRQGVALFLRAYGRKQG
jgi:TetR/AcrR family transcriptional repressor of mexJK operon